MSQTDTTSLHESRGESSDELTHVSEVFEESGIPVSDGLKERMLHELVRLTREETRTNYDADRRRSA